MDFHLLNIVIDEIRNNQQQLDNIPNFKFGQNQQRWLKFNHYLFWPIGKKTFVLSNINSYKYIRISMATLNEIRIMSKFKITFFFYFRIKLAIIQILNFKGDLIMSLCLFHSM